VQTFDEGELSPAAGVPHPRDEVYRVQKRTSPKDRTTVARSRPAHSTRFTARAGARALAPNYPVDATRERREPGDDPSRRRVPLGRRVGAERVRLSGSAGSALPSLLATLARLSASVTTST